MNRMSNEDKKNIERAFNNQLSIYDKIEKEFSTLNTMLQNVAKERKDIPGILYPFFVKIDDYGVNKEIFLTTHLYNSLMALKALKMDIYKNIVFEIYNICFPETKLETSTITDVDIRHQYRCTSEKESKIPDFLVIFTISKKKTYWYIEAKVGSKIDDRNKKRATINSIKNKFSTESIEYSILTKRRIQNNEISNLLWQDIFFVILKNIYKNRNKTEIETVRALSPAISIIGQFLGYGVEIENFNKNNEENLPIWLSLYPQLVKGNKK